MARLSKQEQKLHDRAMELINSDRPLTYEEKEFCYNNYHGDGLGGSGAFFTPEGLAWDFTIDAHCTGKVLDLCAGIGRLSFCMLHRCKPEKIVCIELNPEFARIGKRLLPEAEWITSDVFEFESNEKFDVVISNPPFGKIKTTDTKDVFEYTGGEFEFKVMTLGQKFAEVGYFIVPAGSAGFAYSGRPYYDGSMKSNKYLKWSKQTGLVTYAGCGIDTSIYRDEWHSTNVLTEVVEVRYYEKEAVEAPKSHSNKQIEESKEITLPEQESESGTLSDLFDI